MHTEARLWTVRGAALAFGVGLVAVVAVLGFQALPALGLVFIAVLLAAALEPVTDGLRNRLPLPRPVAILAVYAGFIAVVIGFMLLVVPAIIDEGQAALDRLPDFLATARTWAEDLRPVALSISLTSLIRSAEHALIPEVPDPNELVAAGLTVAEVTVFVVTLLAVVFFWLVERPRLQRYALSFVPRARRAGARSAWERIETRLGLWVRGQLLLMGAIGLATGIAYSLLGLPGALLLALIAAIAEAIPIVGPLIGAIPAVVVAATVSPELAIVVAVIYLAIQLVEGNVLVPLVMRNTIGLSPFVVLVSLLFGAAIAGIVGAFLAVPIAATVEVLLEQLQAREVPVSPEPSPRVAEAAAKDAEEDAARAARVSSAST